jgi:hypothetical protein
MPFSGVKQEISIDATAGAAVRYADRQPRAEQGVLGIGARESELSRTVSRQSDPSWQT